jgi:hypothetical protein
MVGQLKLKRGKSATTEKVTANGASETPLDQFMAPQTKLWDTKLTEEVHEQGNEEAEEPSPSNVRF